MEGWMPCPWNTELVGCLWLPRMLDKGRRALEGEHQGRYLGNYTAQDLIQLGTHAPGLPNFLDDRGGAETQARVRAPLCRRRQGPSRPYPRFIPPDRLSHQNPNHNRTTITPYLAHHNKKEPAPLQRPALSTCLATAESRGGPGSHDLRGRSISNRRGLDAPRQTDKEAAVHIGQQVGLVLGSGPRQHHARMP